MDLTKETPQEMEGHPMGEKSKEARMATKEGAIDELSLQNAIRAQYKKNWPSVILECNKRIMAVNQTWNKIIWQTMSIPGLSINYERRGDSLIITVTFKHPESSPVKCEEVEEHEITIDQLGEASQYIEVAIMDKLDHSKLIARLDAEHVARIDAERIARLQEQVPE